MLPSMLAAFKFELFWLSFRRHFVCERAVTLATTIQNALTPSSFLRCPDETHMTDVKLGWWVESLHSFR